MNNYLSKLKNKKQPTGVLQKLQKGGKPEKEPCSSTAKTAKRPFYSKSSTPVGYFFGKKISDQNQTPPPDLSRIHPEHRSEYTTLWYQAHALADYVDGGAAVAPYPERSAKLPELNQMVERMLKPVKTPKNAQKKPGRTATDKDFNNNRGEGGAYVPRSKAENAGRCPPIYGENY